MIGQKRACDSILANQSPSQDIAASTAMKAEERAAIQTQGKSVAGRMTASPNQAPSGESPAFKELKGGQGRATGQNGG